MSRLPACPCCHNKNTVATTIFEPENAPNNEFIVSCSPTNGGCGLHTNPQKSWQAAADAWIKLCNSMPLTPPAPLNDSLVLTVTYECPSVYDRWCAAAVLSGNNKMSFEDIVAELEDQSICPKCGERAKLIRAVLTSGDDEYRLRLIPRSYFKKNECEA